MFSKMFGEKYNSLGHLSQNIANIDSIVQYCVSEMFSSLAQGLINSSVTYQLTYVSNK